MIMKKMNFEILFVILFFFEKFEHIFASLTIECTIQLATDTPEKKQQIKEAYEKISYQVNYRFDTEEKARLELETQINTYEQQTKTTFSEDEPPEKTESRTAKKLWDNAKKAYVKFTKTQEKFAGEKFCKPGSTSDICKGIFKNSYFKKEKLTYDGSRQYECPKANFEFKKEDGTVENKSMELKVCWGIDGTTKSSVRVYIQSAFKQPFVGGTKFFVLFAYFYDRYSQAWKQTSDVHISSDELKYRYEAYLSMSWL